MEEGRDLHPIEAELENIVSGLRRVVHSNDSLNVGSDFPDDNIVEDDRLAASSISESHSEDEVTNHPSSASSTENLEWRALIEFLEGVETKGQAAKVLLRNLGMQRVFSEGEPTAESFNEGLIESCVNLLLEDTEIDPMAKKGAGRDDKASESALRTIQRALRKNQGDVRNSQWDVRGDEQTEIWRNVENCQLGPLSREAEAMLAEKRRRKKEDLLKIAPDKPGEPEMRRLEDNTQGDKPGAPEERKSEDNALYDKPRKPEERQSENLLTAASSRRTRSSPDASGYQQFQPKLRSCRVKIMTYYRKI